MNELNRAREMYANRYRIDWTDRSYMWHPRNPISIVHNQILDRKVIQALNTLEIDLLDKMILDVGSGYGRLLRLWAEMGAAPSKLFGIDLMDYRLQHARALMQESGYVVSSAAELPFPDQSFDILSQFSVFSSIYDKKLRQSAAMEMGRVLRPSGWLIWYDVSSGKGGTPHPISKRDTIDLFHSLELKLCLPVFSKQLIRVIRFNVGLAFLWEKLPFIPKNGVIIIFKKPA